MASGKIFKSTTMFCEMAPRRRVHRNWLPREPSWLNAKAVHETTLPSNPVPDLTSIADININGRFALPLITRSIASLSRGRDLGRHTVVKRRACGLPIQTFGDPLWLAK